MNITLSVSWKISVGVDLNCTVIEKLLIDWERVMFFKCVVCSTVSMFPCYRLNGLMYFDIKGVVKFVFIVGVSQAIKIIKTVKRIFNNRDF